MFETADSPALSCLEVSKSTAPSEPTPDAAVATWSDLLSGGPGRYPLRNQHY